MTPKWPSTPLAGRAKWRRAKKEKNQIIKSTHWTKRKEIFIKISPSCLYYLGSNRKVKILKVANIQAGLRSHIEQDKHPSTNTYLSAFFLDLGLPGPFNGCFSGIGRSASDLRPTFFVMPVGSHKQQIHIPEDGKWTSLESTSKVPSKRQIPLDVNWTD